MVFSAAEEWRNHSLGGEAGGLEPDRAAFYFAGIFSFAALGRGNCWIRPECVQRRSIEPGADEFGVNYARERRRAEVAGGKSWGADSCGSGYQFGLGAGSAYFARGCGISDCAGGAGAGDERGGCSRVRGAPYGGAAVWIPRGAAGQCVGIEFGVGCGASLATEMIA